MKVVEEDVFLGVAKTLLEQARHEVEEERCAKEKELEQNFCRIADELSTETSELLFIPRDPGSSLAKKVTLGLYAIQLFFEILLGESKRVERSYKNIQDFDSAQWTIDTVRKNLSIISGKIDSELIKSV